MNETSLRHVEDLNRAGALREVVLSERAPDGTPRCNMCQWRCRIGEGGVGHCKTVVNHDGVLYSTIYGVISSAAADPIEKKPVFHFKPGSLCFSVGTLGCNFRCVFCQNWQIAYADALDSAKLGCRTGFLPENLVSSAKSSGCAGVAWTYNEPSIWLNYTLDCAKLCKQEGLYTVYVTNGYATPEALDAIGPFLDVYRVDIKSMEDSFYKELVKIPRWRGILDVAVRAKSQWRMHVEVVTNVIPGWNDGDRNLTETARWIAESLGPETPWHVSRFVPYGELSHVSPTPPETLERAVKIGRDAGLEFVYLGNMRSSAGENTYCPKCGNLAVRRQGYQAEVTGVTQEGKCIVDGADLNMRM
jgi:pyruvate formate lyase activating enzyme